MGFSVLVFMTGVYLDWDGFVDLAVTFREK